MQRVPLYPCRGRGRHTGLYPSMASVMVLYLTPGCPMRKTCPTKCSCCDPAGALYDNYRDGRQEKKRNNNVLSTNPIASSRTKFFPWWKTKPSSCQKAINREHLVVVKRMRSRETNQVLYPFFYDFARFQQTEFDLKQELGLGEREGSWRQTSSSNEKVALGCKFGGAVT